MRGKGREDHRVGDSGAHFDLRNPFFKWSRRSEFIRILLSSALARGVVMASV